MLRPAATAATAAPPAAIASPLGADPPPAPASGRVPAPVSGANRAGGSPARSAMPAIFLAHGSPFLLDDDAWMAELAAWAGALPRPRAILMISAHWEERPLTI